MITILCPYQILPYASITAGPPLYWFGVAMASLLVGIADFAVYYTTINYMVAAYGPHSAAATDGNGFMESSRWR